MKLGIAVPSNNPSAFFNHFLGSIQWLRPLVREHEVRILLTAQDPWTISELEEAKRRCDVWNLPLMYCYAIATKPPLMCYLRECAVSLWQQADVYMLGDDNMTFVERAMDREIKHGLSSGEKYCHVLEYMKIFARCGVVQCHTSDPFFMKHTIAPTDNGLISTVKGLFIRNIFKGELWPPWSWRFQASLEETVAAYRVLEEGYFPARQYQNPTIHPIHKIGADDTLHSKWLIDQYCGNWVRHEFEDPQWKHESQLFPAKLIWRAKLHGGEAVSFNQNEGKFTWIP